MEFSLSLVMEFIVPLTSSIIKLGRIVCHLKLIGIMRWLIVCPVLIFYLESWRVKVVNYQILIFWYARLSPEKRYFRVKLKVPKQPSDVNPYFTISKIAEDLKIAYSTAQRGVQKLEAVGIIKKTNDNKRDKVYCATAILNILEEPTKIRADV